MAKKYGLIWEDDPKKVDPEGVIERCKVEIPILQEIKGKRLEKKNTGPDQIVKDMDYDPNKQVESPTHLLIEGDNYHVLAALNYTHRQKIDVIYIDPPYNTGNKDFMYNDHWIDPNDSYRHSKWLSFMNVRLKLAKNLLKDTGVIFISIDDHEHARLKLLCDEVFGDENFLNTIVWKKTNSPKSQTKGLGNQLEYVLVYSRNVSILPNLNRKIGDITEKYTKTFSYNDGDDKGKYRTIEIVAHGVQNTPNRKRFEFHGATEPWLYSLETLEKWWKKGLISTSKNGRHRKKQYLKGISNKIISDDWTDEIKPLQGSSDEYINFTTQKPLRLIEKILTLINNKSAKVLDFFAGSGTTGHAVLELNKEDGGNRQFILCTNNENNICTEVCYPRITKVMEGYKTPKGKKVEGLGGSLKYYRTAFEKRTRNTDNRAKKPKQLPD